MSTIELVVNAVKPELTMLSHALGYINEPLNWRLCQLRPHSKAPMLAEWNSDSRAVGDATVATGIWSNSQFGIGLVHESSHTGAFDVDHLEYAALAFAEFGIDILALMAGYPRIKGRDGRDKIIFNVPVSNATIKLVWPAKEAGDKPTTVFELRGKGGQDVLPPSIHPDTMQPYTWQVAPWDLVDGVPTIPAQLLAIWDSWTAFKPQFEAACPWATKAVERPSAVVRKISSENNNIIGQFNNCHSMAAILAEHGYKQRGKRWLSPTSSSNIPGVIIFDDGTKERCYSHHASDPLNTGKAHDAFDLIVLLDHYGDFNAALLSAANVMGISPSIAEKIEFDIDELIANSSKKQAAKPFVKTPAVYEFPKHLLNVPGMVGDMSRYMSATARFPQPVLELGASLAFCGALMGRKIRTKSNIRTNIYTIGINVSGSGKEHARKCIKNLSVQAEATNYVGAEKIASDAGLFNLLHIAPSTLWLADEFGRVLRAMNNSRAPTYLQNLSTQIMELSGSADSFLIEPRKASTGIDKTDPTKIIHNPNLCIYGTTVPGRLFDSLTPEEIEDGFLPRWLLFESDIQDQEPQQHGKVDCDDLIALIKAWSVKPINAYQEGNVDFLNPNPAIASSDCHADLIFGDYEKVWRKRKIEFRGFGVDAVWARAYEHALRVALIRAGGINIDFPHIDEAGAQWSCELIDFLLLRESAQAMDCVAKNDHDSAIKKLSKFIRDNSPVQRRVLAIKFQHIKAKERNEMLGQLVEAELISIEKTQMSDKGGPATVVFSWIG